MRTAALLCLSFGLSFAASAAECDSAIKIIEEKGQLIIKNISGKPIVAYVFTSVNSKSQDGSPTRTFSGTFGGGGFVRTGTVYGDRQSGNGPKRTIRRLRPICGWLAVWRSAARGSQQRINREVAISPSPH